MEYKCNNKNLLLLSLGGIKIKLVLFIEDDINSDMDFRSKLLIIINDYL